VSVYPNPCNEKLTVSINDNTYEEHTLKLMDVLGKEVCSVNTYNKTIEINCSNLSKGIYVVMLSSKSDNYHQVITKKIIIN
jgi:hypothetical protein